MIPIYNINSFQDTYFMRGRAQASSDATHCLSHPPIGSSYFKIRRLQDPNHTCKRTIFSNRREFYTIVLITKGKGIHTSGANRYQVTSNMLGFIPPSQITTWEAQSDKLYGYCCFFMADYFLLNLENKTMLDEFPLFQLDGQSFVHLTDEQTAMFYDLFQKIEVEYSCESIGKDNVIRLYLNLLLIHAQRLSSILETNLSKSVQAGWRLTRQFLRLVEQHFHSSASIQQAKARSVSDYAEILRVHPNHLSNTVKRVTGRTAGDHIRERIILEAKSLLHHTELTVSEIAYNLAFEEPSYFSHFFKKYTHQSPGEFRESSKL